LGRGGTGLPDLPPSTAQTQKTTPAHVQAALAQVPCGLWAIAGVGEIVLSC
jgi:hypothetical protein